MKELLFEAVSVFCARREVDLVLVAPPAPYALSVRAEFDACGDFFRVLPEDLFFVEFPNRVTVGGLKLVRISEVGDLRQKWSHLADEYSGEALVVRSYPFTGSRAGGTA